MVSSRVRPGGDLAQHSSKRLIAGATYLDTSSRGSRTTTCSANSRRVCAVAGLEVGPREGVRAGDVHVVFIKRMAKSTFMGTIGSSCRTRPRSTKATNASHYWWGRKEATIGR